MPSHLKIISILFLLCTLTGYGQSYVVDSGNNQLRPGHPGTFGMDSLEILSRVDSIIQAGISANAFPGAQVLVAKNGHIVFHQAYGFHTYDRLQRVHPEDLYDLASVTKIMGPIPAIMKLVDEGKLQLDLPFSNYWRPWRHIKDKKDLTLREILSHQAGLVPYIVFLNRVMKDGELKNRFFRRQRERKFQLQAYENLYVKDRFIKKMYRIINRSEVKNEKKYLYSGLAFLIFPELIARLGGMPYETYLQQNFYIPMGCSTMGFNPSLREAKNAIIPTEMDTLYRKALTTGWVHDENASLMGGVSGNAGLFGTALDLAKMMQLFQNYGTYGNKKYFSEATVKEFTKVQFPENDNRRGLGFDKPELHNDTMDIAEAYPAPLAGKSSFGHSGFTGTFVWADPENQLVFIFLSNRVFPTREHRNLYTLNIRTAVQQVFYEALLPNTDLPLK